MTDLHETVLAEATVSALVSNREGLYVDATFGRGGHSRRLLQVLGSSAQLLVIDRDQRAIAVAEALALRDRRVVVRQGSFSELGQWLTLSGWMGQVSGVLMDLGVSSPQLDAAERGFSFQADGPLDMRMDQDQAVSAQTVLAEMDEKSLAELFVTYGEERYARRIARALVEARKKEPLLRTLQVANLIARAHPSWERHKHPATRCFQALRLYVNRELEELQQVLPMAQNALCSGGRLAVISFHSLEDRIVKQFFRQGVAPVQDRHAMWNPQAQALRPVFSYVIKRMEPSAEEVQRNPRSRSAHLRVVERLAVG